MPANVAATGLWRSVISTNSSRSPPNSFAVSVMGLRWVRTKAPAPSARRPGSNRYGSGSADPGDVGGLVALGSGHHVELDAIALGQGPESVRLDRREVYEHLLASVVSNEAEAFRLTEPLHGALHAGALGRDC